MHDRLENFLAAFRLSQRAADHPAEFVCVARTVAVLVVFCADREDSVARRVVGHEGSTVIVVMNSLRLLFGGNSKPPA